MKSSVILSFAAILALLAAATLFAADIGTGLQITPNNPAIINSGQSSVTIPNPVPYIGTTPSLPPTLTLPGSTPALPGAGPIDGTRINPSGILGGTASPSLNPGMLPNVPSVVIPPATSTTTPTVP